MSFKRFVAMVTIQPLSERGRRLAFQMFLEKRSIVFDELLCWKQPITIRFEKRPIKYEDISNKDDLGVELFFGLIW